MTGKGHLLTGAIFSFASFKFTNSIGGLGIVTALFTIFGSTAPDWLEIRKGTNTLIPHRTITHWLPIWIIIFIYALSQFNPTLINFIKNINTDLYNIISFKLNLIVSSAILGFSIGGLLHLLFDFPNPMGIPIFTPVHRISLNLWNSGEKEYLIITLTVLFVLYYFDIHNKLNLL
jgi:inner membrane protein